MEPEPSLIAVTAPAEAAGNVLVLHGGAGRGTRAVSSRQLSVMRMTPIARRIARAGEGRLAVHRVLNSTRGWSERRSPVDDVRWALDRLAERGDSRPTCLVGHSLGGRAALFAAGFREVRSAVALAPWVYPTDSPPGLAGREILIVHGTHDRVAPAQRSAIVAERMAQVADVTYLPVEGGKHAMLRHKAQFIEPTVEFVLRTVGGLAEPASSREMEQCAR